MLRLAHSCLHVNVGPVFLKRKTIQKDLCGGAVAAQKHCEVHIHPSSLSPKAHAGQGSQQTLAGTSQPRLANWAALGHATETLPIQGHGSRSEGGGRAGGRQPSKPSRPSAWPGLLRESSGRPATARAACFRTTPGKSLACHGSSRPEEPNEIPYCKGASMNPVARKQLLLVRPSVPPPGGLARQGRGPTGKGPSLPPACRGKGRRNTRAVTSPAAPPPPRRPMSSPTDLPTSLPDLSAADLTRRDRRLGRMRGRRLLAPHPSARQTGPSGSRQGRGFTIERRVPDRRPKAQAASLSQPAATACSLCTRSGAARF